MDALEIPRTQRSAHPRIMQIVHQINQPWLWLLVRHGFALDSLDLVGCLEALLAGEAPNVVENVYFLLDAEGVSVDCEYSFMKPRGVMDAGIGVPHLREHVVLGEAVWFVSFIQLIRFCGLDPILTIMYHPRRIRFPLKQALSRRWNRGARTVVDGGERSGGKTFGE